MKKTVLSIILVIISALLLAGCTAYSYEHAEVEAIVLECEKGTFFPDKELLAMANICLANGKKQLYVYYKKLADENGRYDYNITVTIDGTDYVVVRSTKYEIGTSITVNATYTYTSSGRLVHVEYE